MIYPPVVMAGVRKPSGKEPAGGGVGGLLSMGICRCSGSLEGPDDNHAATATRAWRAMVCCGAGGWVRLVALHRRIGHRHGHGDQFSGTRDIFLAGGAGEQPVVTDAVEPLWQDVEQEAPDELVGGERHGAQPRPAVAAVVLVAEGHTAFVEAEQAAIGDGDTARR